MLPSVSVVIPTRDRRDRVLRAVDAVLADDATLEVVVIDDGSTDDTYDALRARAADDPRVRPLRVPNGGQAAARQTGAEHARGDVVLLLDDDVVAAPGLVTGHARRHAASDDLVVVGYMPTRCPVPRRPGQLAPYVYAENYEWAARSWDADPAAILRTLWGGNVSLRREEALRVGLVAAGPRLLYREDQELGIRLERAGLSGVFDRQLLAWHEHERDVDAFLAEARNRALGAILVHLAHPDVLGPLQLDRYETSMPAPARWAIRAGRNRVVAATEVALLRVVIAAAGAVRWWKLESLAGVVAMHILEVRTIIESGASPP